MSAETDEGYAAEDDEDTEQDETQPSAPILTAKQLPKKEYSKNDDFDAYFDEDKPVSRHVKKIVAAGIGAAVLFGLAVTMDFVGFSPVQTELPTAQYAESSELLFSELHQAYNAGNYAQSEAFPYCSDNSVIFGDMLIYDGAQLGCCTVGESAFAAEADFITVYGEKDGKIAIIAKILPPENADFTEIAANGDKLVAAFKGESFAGFAAYDESGNQLYRTQQSGMLTDITIGVDSVSLGTVYTPAYSESFTVTDIEKYFPLYETGGESRVLPVNNVITDGNATGCGYAVFGEYSLDSGKEISVLAALGDPLYSDSEQFFAVMKTDDGCRLIYLDGEGNPKLVDTPQLITCDMGDTVLVKISEETKPYDSTITAEAEQHVTATAERDENGEIKIYLRGFDYKPISAITGVPQELTSMRIKDGILFICGEGGVLAAADITNPESPTLLSFTEASGVVSGDYALTHEITESAVKLTLYKADENGSVTAVGGTTKPITPAEGKACEMCGANTVFIGGEQLSGAAYTYFDGVSMISEFTVFGKTNTAFTLFDDKNGFTAAAVIGDTLHMIYGENSYTLQK